MITLSTSVSRSHFAQARSLLLFLTAAMPQKGSKGVAVEAKVLEAEWLTLLQHKKPGFCWSGQDYGKPGRKQVNVCH